MPLSTRNSVGSAGSASLSAAFTPLFTPRRGAESRRPAPSLAASMQASQIPARAQPIEPTVATPTLSCSQVQTARPLLADRALGGGRAAPHRPLFTRIYPTVVQRVPRDVQEKPMTIQTRGVLAAAQRPWSSVGPQSPLVHMFFNTHSLLCAVKLTRLQRDVEPACRGIVASIRSKISLCEDEVLINSSSIIRQHGLIDGLAESEQAGDDMIADHHDCCC